MIKPIQRFYDAIKSEHTLKPYTNYLNDFFGYANTDADSIVKMQQKEIEDEHKHRCSQCNAVYRPLIYFKDGYRCEPPPTVVLIADDPYGWSYLEDFNRTSTT